MLLQLICELWKVILEIEEKEISAMSVPNLHSNWGKMRREKYRITRKKRDKFTSILVLELPNFNSQSAT